MNRFAISESYEADCRSSGETRIGEVYHTSTSSGGGATLTPVARYFAHKPGYIENVNPHWRIDCFVRKHRFARNAERISRDLTTALVSRGHCEEPIWLSWYRAEEIKGAAFGEVFETD